MKRTKRSKRSTKRRPAARSSRGRRQTARKSTAKARTRRARTRKPIRAKKAIPKRKKAKLKKTARSRPRAARKPVKARKPARRRPSVSAAAKPRAPRPIAGPSLRPLTSARPSLERSRRQLPEDERLQDRLIAEDRVLSAARTGHDELRASIERHTETGPQLTAGDVDAKWEDAYAVGDEAPGGDNPTPDQDRVDDIGRALGVNYEDGEELKASDKIAERDRHRWELDPASSDDWPHKE